MVQVARANENEVEIYAQHVVDNDEIEFVPLSSEEKEEVERAMEESMRNISMGTTKVDEVMEVDILTSEERNVIDTLVASVQKRVFNVEENVDATQGMEETTQEKVGVTQETQEQNVGPTQNTQETLPQETSIDATKKTQKKKKINQT